MGEGGEFISVDRKQGCQIQKIKRPNWAISSFKKVKFSKIKKGKKG
jgi:hypothetical protein